jgi:hypothetical protein
MPAHLSRADVERIAALAHLALTDERPICSTLAASIPDYAGDRDPIRAASSRGARLSEPSAGRRDDVAAASPAPTGAGNAPDLARQGAPRSRVIA